MTEIRFSIQPTEHTGNSVSPKGPNAAGCCSSRTGQDGGQHTGRFTSPSRGASCFPMTNVSDPSCSGAQILDLSSRGLAGSET